MMLFTYKSPVMTDDFRTVLHINLLLSAKP